MAALPAAAADAALAAPADDGVPEVCEDGLAKQDLATLDISTLHPLSPNVISRQATINIGASLPFSSLLFDFVVLICTFMCVCMRVCE